MVALSVEQISRASHAEVICKMLDVINAVLHGQLEEIRTNCSPGGITNYKETLDASMQNLQDVLKTFKVCTSMCYFYVCWCACTTILVRHLSAKCVIYLCFLIKCVI